jgi:hypothetical protein
MLLYKRDTQFVDFVVDVYRAGFGGHDFGKFTMKPTSK